MPKAALYTLVWSEVCQMYSLHDYHTKLDLVLDLDSPEWRAWLERIPAFAFHGKNGAYSVRKERIQRSGWYWYAYQRMQKKIQKKYLGKSIDLTAQRLEDVALSFASTRAAQNGPERPDDSGSLLEIQQSSAHDTRVQDMLNEAVEHTRREDDLENIVAIAEETGVELISRGEGDKVMNWVHQLPREVMFARPRIFLFETWWLWYTSFYAVAAERMREYVGLHGLPGLEIEDASELEREIEAHISAIYPSSIEQRANMIAEFLALYGLLNMQRSDRAELSRNVCSRAIVRVAGLPSRGRLAQHLCTVLILHGDLSAAIAVLEEALTSVLADGSVLWAYSIVYRLTTLYALVGQLHNITRVAQQILWLGTSTKAPGVQGMSSLLSGAMAYEQQQLELATRYLESGIAICEQVDMSSGAPLLIGQLLLAKIKLIQGDEGGARQLLDESLRSLALAWIGTDVAPALKGLCALLAYDLGDEYAGMLWLQEHQHTVQNNQLLLRQYISLAADEPLLRIRLLLRYQRWQEAEPLLDEQLALAEKQGRIGSLIHLLTQQALLAQGQGDRAQAQVHLTRALALGEPRGYLRVFLDEGACLLPLLYRLRDELRKQRTIANSAPTPGYHKRLLLLCKQEQQQTLVSSSAQIDLVEPLSERECEVLRHISEGCSNQEIARQLVIGLSTVKSHVRAIYTKLGVESRTQALAQARRIKLI